MANQPLDITLGPWEPDAARLNSPFLTEAINALPHPGGGWAPFPEVTAQSAYQYPGADFAAKGHPCGLHFAVKADGTKKRYAGNRTTLALESGGAFVDASRLAGGAYATPTNMLWQFAQYGDDLIAVNGFDDVQSIGVASGTNFAALAGSPPKSVGVSVCGNFVFLWQLLSDRKAIQWSANGSATGWTVGTGLSDLQSFPDGGNVTGVVGDQYGYVLQQECIRTFRFIPGDLNTIFQFNRIPGARGCVSPYGWAAVGDTIFYLSEAGFHSYGPGGPNNIGQNRVDVWFSRNSDNARRQYVQCIADPHQSRIYWAFFASASSTVYDKVIVYDWSLDRWGSGADTAGVERGIYVMAVCDLTLSAADIGVSGSLYFPVGLACFNEFKVLANIKDFMADSTGPLPVCRGQVTFQTAELEPTPGRMTHITGAEFDAIGTVLLADQYFRTKYRNTLIDASFTSTGQTTSTDATAETNTGKLSLRQTARYHQFQFGIDDGKWWGGANRLRVWMQGDGER